MDFVHALILMGDILARHLKATNVVKGCLCAQKQMSCIRDMLVSALDLIDNMLVS